MSVRQVKTFFTSFISTFLIVSVAFASNVAAIEVTITDNGSGSSNTVEVHQESTTTVEQNSSAEVVNAVAASSDTGSNTIATNTASNETIATGNVVENVSVANTLNSAKTELDCCAGDPSSITVSGNGTGTENQVTINDTSRVQITQNQGAKVANTISGVANTGQNSIIGSTGNANIKTGNIYASSQTTNSVNMSSINAPAAGSGVNYSVAVANNASLSNNSVVINSHSNTILYTDYSAYITNDENWDLNTGKNSIVGNSGNSTIETGDILFNLAIINDPINSGSITFNCCDITDPQDPIDNNGDLEAPPVGDGSGLSTTNSSSSGGSSSSDGSSAPGILGLSDTSSPQAKDLIFFAGLVMLAFGAKIIGEEHLKGTSFN